MTQLVARLVLSMLLLPLTGTLIVLSMLALAATGAGQPPILGLAAMWVVVYSFIGAYWIGVWRAVVRWTDSRRRQTAGAAALALAAGTLLATIIASAGAPVQFGMLIGGAVPPTLWVLATVLAWRETKQERIERLRAIGTGGVACPLCGYNMTGLREARCPECGASFTLDEFALMCSENRAEAARSGGGV
ncbi:hypothetical protein RAS1_19960 [Phycisphaerae bacterium RAS1]|nr:hypothetical protein RAS1_19960 [Phycisphaerae bacterium RAS1]